MLHTIAETLVERVNQRLSGNSSGESDSPESQTLLDRPGGAPEVVTSGDVSGEYASTRQARRVKITSTVEVLVDGVASKLVDLSAVGAQIVSPTTLRPNRWVRLVLPTGSTRLNCAGRVVWAQLEPSSGQAAAVYRAGVCFVEGHQSSIEAFAMQHLSDASASRR